MLRVALIAIVVCGCTAATMAGATETRCVPGPPSDVASRAPGTQFTVPVLPPPPSVTGGPPQIVPAAEQNPPSGR
jgi:hypothetical protein